MTPLVAQRGSGNIKAHKGFGFWVHNFPFHVIIFHTIEVQVATLTKSEDHSSYMKHSLNS